MKKFLESNLFYAVLAVIMAVFLTFYVSSAENPIVEKPFANVNVTVAGLPEGYLLEHEPGPAEILVSGYKSTINFTFIRDIKAYVDLSHAHPGTNEYVIHTTLPTGVTLVRTRPDYVELTIDVFATKELPVYVETLNAVQPGFSSLEPAARPSVVTVSGPERLLDMIEEARVSLDLAGRTADFDGSLPVALIGANQEEFVSNRVSLSEREVSVFVDISENLASRSVTVRTPMSGDVDDRHIVAGVEVWPSTVKITGSYAVISTIEYLNTEAIDLTSMTETFHDFIRLITPPNVEVLEGNQVEITIRIEKNLTRRTITGVPVTIRNAPEDQVYATDPAEVDITLSAYPDIVDRDTRGGVLAVRVSAYVDLEGEPAGEQAYPLILDVPEDYLAIQVSHDSATVTPTAEPE